MARPLRVEYPGALYHVTSRGNAREAIFFDDKDRARFLSIFSDVIKDCHWICYAYCLMSNHYHLLIETPDANLSVGMRQVNGIYTQATNNRHNRSGHIFQGRFKALLVEKQSHLLELCRYIVQNPVAADMVQSPQAWSWSSYHATAGLRATPDFLSTDWILAQFSDSRAKAMKLYQEFVLSGTAEESPWKDLKAGLFVGSVSFVDEIKDSIRAASPEFPKQQRFAARPLLPDIILSRSEVTDEQIARARRSGYSLKEIGDYLSIHYATVSRRAKRGTTQMDTGNAKNKT
jgi:putative transposase